MHIFTEHLRLYEEKLNQKLIFRQRNAILSLIIIQPTPLPAQSYNKLLLKTPLFVLQHNLFRCEITYYIGFEPTTFSTAALIKNDASQTNQTWLYSVIYTSPF